MRAPSSSSAGLKGFLRQWPAAYSWLHGTYYRALFAAERRFLGTRLHEVMWSRRAGGTRADLLKTIAHPHRPFLRDAIGKWAPFDSVLEIGCNAGPNLLLLARVFPQARFTGIDINRHFVDAGTDLLRDEGVENVTLSVGAADDLARFESKSIDVTFTDATLMYVGPDKIAGTLAEIVRVTRKAVVFNEWCTPGLVPGTRSVWYYMHWVHDFRPLLAEAAPGRPVTVTPVPHELWGPDGWREYGALVEMSLG